MRIEIFVHYDRQLRASHLILSCVPSYTSYQDSLGTLTVGSPLLSYLDVQLLGFLQHELTSGETRHQGSRRVRQGSREPIRDGSTDMIFHDRAVHIPVEASAIETLVPTNSTARMVQQRTMALDYWFLGAQPVRIQAAPQSTP